ncbi:MAG: DDE-type integrase/transposase/recombinase [bacterium]|nr:DDE-type integrase/transposase/recombinase [bacterium]
MDVLGTVEMPIDILGTTATVQFAVVRDLSPQCILGMDVLGKLGAVIDTRKGTIQFGDSVPAAAPMAAVAVVGAKARAEDSTGVQGGEESLEGEEEYKDAVQYATARAEKDDHALAEDAELEKLLPTITHEELTEAQKADVGKLLAEFRDVIGVPGKIIGCTASVTHAIDTGDARPLQQRMFRTSPADREAIQEELQKLLKSGAIRRSSSPWASRMLIVPKKDGSRRVVIDYRGLNNLTAKDAYPLPRIDDTLAALGRSMYYSALDLASGFWQVRMESRDIEKTAFVVDGGLYEWVVMPMGLTNSPATFQRLMNVVMAEVRGKFVLVYLDDLIVYSPTWEAHLDHLREVLRRLRKHNLKVKLKKCSFGATEVQYLGHVVNRHGVAVDPAKIEAVKRAARPTNLKELQSFLGLAGYYRKFVPDYAKKAEPMTRLTKKDTPYVWGAEQDKAFEALKEALTSAPVLIYPHLDEPFTVFTDASDLAVGAVLAQFRPDASGGKPLEHVVEYASKKLSKPERNYTTTEKECLAIVWAVKRYRHYLEGRRFVVVTDHAALKWLFKGDSPSMRIRRWASLLQSMDFEIVHRAGRIHYNADALSRMVVERPDGSRGVGLAAISELREEVEKAQDGHGGIQMMKEYLETGTLPPTEGGQAARIERAAEKYLVRDGLVYYREEEGGQARLVVPRELRQKFLRLLHDNPTSGHAGVKRTMARVAKEVYWKGWRRDVEDYVAACVTCAKGRIKRQSNKALLKAITPKFPFETVALDITGPMTETASGNRYLLVFTEYFTRYADAWPLRETRAETLARTFVDEVISRYGLPCRLLTDNGSNFTAKFMASVCALLKIRRAFTTTYHPQTDGVVERFNGTLKAVLRKYISADQKDWDQHVRLALYAYNTSVHAALGETPFFLMYGREPRTVTQAALGMESSAEPLSVTEYRELLMRRIKQGHEMAAEAREKASRRMEARARDTRTPHEFRVGDRVFLHVPAVKRGLSAKLAAKWAGPYRIETMRGKHHCRLVGVRQTLRQWIHVDRLLPYTDKTPTGVPDVADDFDPSLEDEAEFAWDA